LLRDRRPLPDDRPVERFEPLGEMLHHALGFELAAYEPARERFVGCGEADIELAVEVAKRRLGLRAARRHGFALGLERLQSSIALRDCILHLADRLTHQRLGLFDAVEDGVQVRRQEPRHSMNQRHVRPPYCASGKGPFPIRTTRGSLSDAIFPTARTADKTRKCKSYGPRFTKDLHAASGHGARIFGVRWRREPAYSSSSTRPRFARASRTCWSSPASTSTPSRTAAKGSRRR